MYYFSFSVQCTLTLLLQLKQTPTDSSYKPSFKKKDRPGTEKQWYKPYGYSAKFRGDPCSYEVDFFPPAIACGLPPTAHPVFRHFSVQMNVIKNPGTFISLMNRKVPPGSGTFPFKKKKSGMSDTT